MNLNLKRKSKILNINIRSHMVLVIPLGQKCVSFMGELIWNKLINILKMLNTSTSFTHNYKKLVLKNLSK